MASLRLGARRTAKGRMPRNVAPCRRLVKCLYSRRPGTRPVPWSRAPPHARPLGLPLPVAHRCDTANVAAASRHFACWRAAPPRMLPAVPPSARSAASAAGRGCSTDGFMEPNSSSPAALSRGVRCATRTLAWRAANGVQGPPMMPARSSSDTTARARPARWARPVPQSSPCSTEGIAQPPEYDRTLGRPLQNGSLDFTRSVTFGRLSI